MYQAKKAKKHLSYYDENLDKAQKELFVLQHELTAAIAENQFEIFFQPIVTIKEDKLVGAETLIRWEHPTKGLLVPADFIPLAIKAGLLGEITWWMVDALCQIIVKWKQEKQLNISYVSLNINARQPSIQAKKLLLNISYVSLNINARQLLEEDFAQLFLKKLETFRLEPQMIMLEITERSLIDNFEYAQSVINALRKYGVRCAIDDFGAGYSSLSYLKKLSFDTLKIDKEFIKDIVDNPKEAHLVSAILDIGKEFGYKMIVVGVENEAQKKELLKLDERLLYQGFYLSGPMQLDQFTQRYLSA